MLALIAAVVLATLATLGWQIRPVKCEVFLPAPPWTPLALSASGPVAGGDDSLRFVDVAVRRGYATTSPFNGKSRRCIRVTFCASGFWTEFV